MSNIRQAVGRNGAMSLSVSQISFEFLKTFHLFANDVLSSPESFPKLQISVICIRPSARLSHMVLPEDGQPRLISKA